MWFFLTKRKKYLFTSAVQWHQMNVSLCVNLVWSLWQIESFSLLSFRCYVIGFIHSLYLNINVFLFSQYDDFEKRKKKWLRNGRKLLTKVVDLVWNGLNGFVFKSVSFGSFRVCSKVKRKFAKRCREFLFTCYTRTHSLTHLHARRCVSCDYQESRCPA